MILCITEKPSVGADIARIVGANVRRDGYFEGPEYCVTWTFGHLCELKDPADYTPNWKRWSLAALPMIPPRFGIKIKDEPSIRRQMEIIESLIKRADRLINCGDAGQEGELIQRWVMQLANCNIPVERLWISSLTDDAIREGFAHLRPQHELESLYTAGLCRAIGDWILGINATRLYTLRYSSNRQILSVGRVQTPTLALVVNRQKEIEEFKPKDSWELRTRYRNVIFSTQRKPFEIEESGLPEVERLSQFPFVISDISTKKGKEGPPKLFDLTSLQVEANRKFGMSAEQTLKTIQSLYEKKIATYPRVDTTYLTDDIYPKCGQIMNSLVSYHSLMGPIRGKTLRKSKKVFDNSKVTDHHAIIPTGQPVPAGLTDAEQKIFDLVARRFIAVFFPDASFEQTTVKGKVDQQEFKATGKRYTDLGWKILFQSDNKGQEENPSDHQDSAEQSLPQFVAGETGPHEPFLAKKTTQPPKYYTEGTLLKAMETAGSFVEDETLREALKANGIGRPSTRAAIIETLYKRGYIVQERKSLRATPAGIQLISLIRDELLKSAKLTGIWEGKLREIERGEYSASAFIDQLKAMIQKVTLSVLQDNSPTRIENPSPELDTLKRKDYQKSRKSESSRRKAAS